MRENFFARRGLRPPVISQRTFVGLLLLGFFLLGCSPAPVDSHPPQPLSYASTWEYRWGDSPRGPQGERLWAQPARGAASDPTQWKETTSPFERLPGRNGSEFLWLRTKLKGAPLRDGVLYVRPVDRLMEAYLDGELIYQFGDMQQEPPYRFIGFRPHFIPLPAQYQGKVLALRVYSELSNIGPSGQVWLAERAEVVKQLFLNELERLFVGGLLALIGLAAISLYLLRKEERVYLMYGCFAVSIGVYSTSQIQVQTFLIDWPLFWPHLELAALFLAMIFLCSYLEHMFGRGPFGLVRALRIAHTIFAIGAAVAVLTKLVPLWKTVPPFQVLFLFDLAYLTCFVVYIGVLGNVEVRIFALGFVIAAGLALLELLGSYRIVKKTILTHYGMAAFTLSLGAILARRFLSVHKRLRDYSSVLQLSLASISAFDPEERTHVALQELVRIQRARRALLFQVEEGNNQLTLTAGRDDRGADLVAFRDFDKQSIDQAFARRTPIIVQREGAEAAPRSIMATPILTGNKVLGVLYLETEGTRRIFQPEDQEILLGLGSQIASTLVSSRAMRLELDRALAHRRLHEQRELLDAAGRMAKGDLDSTIVVPEKHELAPLAGALDGMRQDLRGMQEELKAKVAQLESRNQEVQLLNDELRRQIEQRSRRLLDILLPKDDALSQAAQLAAGSLLGDFYRVLRVLGKGGMGVVYEVERTTDCRRLAAKVLSAQPDRTAIGRFVREAQILARLDHPNLIAISDIDVTSSGVLFIVMELVDGSSLGQHRAEFGRANRRWELHILRQVAEALVALHAQGVVHRDLKPENVLLTRCPEGALPVVKLADFGISILLDEMRSVRLMSTPSTPAADTEASPVAAATAITEDGGPAASAGALATISLATEPGHNSAQALTKTGMIVGTPLYMAPELYSGSKNAQPPADIFSLGVIAFELLTAQLPFARPAIVARALREEVAAPSLSQLRTDLPPALLALLERCLSAEPEKRPTAQQVALQLVAT